MFIQIYSVILSTFILHTAVAQRTGQITVLTEPVVSFAGESAVLNCTVSSPADAASLISVQWNFLNSTSGSKTISQSCVITEDNNDDADGEKKYELDCIKGKDTVLYSLKVNTLSVPDYGTYECATYVQNVVEKIDSMPVTLTVLSPPKMAYASSDLVADAFIGSNVSLACMAEGVPAPNVTWGKANGKPLPGDGRSFSVRRQASATRTVQTLTLLNVTKEERGSYRCSADNSVRPPDEMYSKLSVEFKPSVSAVEPSYGTAVDNDNSEAMLWCKVDGNPLPIMSWYAMTQQQSQRFADGELELTDDLIQGKVALFTDEKYLVEQKIMTVGSLSTMDSMFYSLVLQTVEANDMVYYICRAENTHGVGYQAIQLYRVNTLTGSGTGSSTGHTVQFSLSIVLISLLALLHVRQ